MDRLSDLEIFVAVVDASSFTGAARGLGVSKSHVSRQIQALEDRLGARLLHRTTRTLHLTDVGAAFHERAQRILAELDEAERAVTALQTEPRGQLKIGAPLSFGLSYVSPVIERYMLQWPEVTVEAGFSDRRVDVVADGYDLVVRIGSLADSSLIVRKLASTRTFIVASPAYVERYGAPETPDALAEHLCLRYTHQTTGNTWLLRRADGAEATVRIDGRMTSDNGDALLGACRAGLGLTYVPDFFVAEDLAAGRLVTVLEDWTQIDSPISVLYPHNRHLSAKVRMFVDALKAHVAQQPWCTHGSPDRTVAAAEGVADIS